MMHKKGNVGNGLFFMVAIFAIGVVFIIMNLVLSSVNTEIQATDAISDLGKNLVQENTDKFPNIFDNMISFLFIGIAIAVIAAAWFSRTHPLIFFITIPILAFMVVMAALYANIYGILITDPDIGTAATNFTIFTFIMNNYVYFIVGIMIIVTIATFAKNRRSDL